METQTTKAPADNWDLVAFRETLRIGAKCSKDSRGFRLPADASMRELFESRAALGWSASLPDDLLPRETREYCRELASGIAEQIRERIKARQTS